MLKAKLGLMALLLGLLILVTATNPMPAFTPPTHAIVVMYRLNMDGTIWTDTNKNSSVLCSSTDYSYGCTAFIGDVTRPYPYDNDNPVLVPIETDYLLDVLAQEMGSLSFHPEAQHAQAIAARTFAYFHEQFDDVTLNNSTESQVFVPYRFERWEAESNFSPNGYDPCLTQQTRYLLPQQQRLCQAVNASKSYITDGVPLVLPADTLPARTEYFADVAGSTKTNPSVTGPSGQLLYPYLQAVPEPISAGGDSGSGYGLSQRGASRWAYGDLGWQGNVGYWSAGGWSAHRILAHYYTGIELRNPEGETLWPAERWQPLQIAWGTADQRPPPMAHGGAYPLTMQVQNTGTADWLCTSPAETYLLQYRWTRHGQQQVGAEQVSVCGLARGEAAFFPLTVTDIPDWGVGTYGLQFDLGAADGSFRFGERGWPTHTTLVCVGLTTCGEVFLPATFGQGLLVNQ